MNGTMERVVKHSFLYTFVASQPFAVYVDAYPALQNKVLMEEAERLKYGEHSQIVRVLQEKLSDLSYYKDPVDGEFDIITEHALKKFQKDFDINMTGLADPHTVHAVIEAEKSKMLLKVEKLTESIDIQMKSDSVETVQEVLQYFGYYEGELDGIYGPLTENALKKAEAEHEIDLMDNIAGPSLAELYESENAENEESINSPQPSNKEETEDKSSTNKNEQQEVKSVQVEGVNDLGIVEAAHAFIGTPYVWGGDTPGGFDCSGFIHYVYQSRNITIPRTVSDVWNFGNHVDSPSVGDLVFFETYKPGPSHMGIYLGDGKFIHAGESRGVEISEMSNSYWEGKYLGAKRIN